MKIVYSVFVSAFVSANKIFFFDVFLFTTQFGKKTWFSKIRPRVPVLASVLVSDAFMISEVRREQHRRLQPNLGSVYPL